MKKTIIASIILIAGLLITGGYPSGPPSGRVNLVWDYPTNELSPDLVFRLFHSTNITVPMTNWVVLTNVPGTSTSVSVVITPGIHFFVMTASNFWGESDFSNVASTPALPRSATSPRITRTD